MVFSGRRPAYGPRQPAPRHHENERLNAVGRPRRVQTHWPGAAVSNRAFTGPGRAITSVSAKAWIAFKHCNAPHCGFAPRRHAADGNALESFGLKRTHLFPTPWWLSKPPRPARANGRYYKRFRKRWWTSTGIILDARYIYTMATLLLGETDTLFFPRGVLPHGFRGPVAVD